MCMYKRLLHNVVTKRDKRNKRTVSLKRGTKKEHLSAEAVLSLETGAVKGVQVLVGNNLVAGSRSLA